MAVSFIKTDDYEQQKIRSSLEQLFTLQNVKLSPQTRVVLKPNLIMRCLPARAATTHPAIIRAVTEILRDMGISDITLADSPGGIYSQQILTALYQSTGLKEVAEATGLKLNMDTSSVCRRREENLLCKEFDIITPLTGDVCVFNLCKLKTHCMMTMTAGVKNLFGSVPGLLKPELHYRFPQHELFARMLVDLFLTVAPAYTIVDAVDCMEGDGPTGGQVRHVGLTAMASGEDTFSLDLVLCHLIGMTLEEVPTVREAIRQGHSPENWEQVALSGDVELARQVQAFVKPRSKTLDFSGNLWKPFQPILRAIRPMLESRPVIKTKLCVGCGKCAQTCPVHTIEINGGKARIKPADCIRCFCCHELCPVRAIEVKTPKFFRWLT